MYIGKYKNEYVIHAMSLSLSVFLSCFIVKTKIGSLLGLSVLLLIACVFCVYNAGYCYGCIVDYRARTKWRKSEDKRIVPDMIGCCVGGFCVFLLLSLLLLVSKEFTIVVDALIGFYIGTTYRTHLEKLEI